MIFPPGTPIDEPVTLLAHATPGESRSATIALAQDGTFDATLPVAWHAIGLDLRARSLYCPNTTWIYLDSGDESVELRPELACQLEIRILLPPGVTDEEVAKAKGAVSLFESGTGHSIGDSRSVCLAEHRTVRFERVCLSGAVDVFANIFPFRPSNARKASLIAGQCTQVDMTLERGACVSGQVVTDTGEPVSGVEVLSFLSSFDTPDGGIAATTDADGRFQLAGLPGGNDYLMAWRTRLNNKSRPIGSLRVESLLAGRSYEGLLIVVKP